MNRRRLRREASPGFNENKEKERRLIFSIISIFVALIITFSIYSYIVIDESTPKLEKKDKTVIYYNEACAGCLVYIEEDLIPTLNGLGYDNITKKDYVNNVEYRKELNFLMESDNIPYYYQSHIMTFIFSNSTVILGGHVPVHVITGLMTWENVSTLEKVLVVQDDMENPSRYVVLGSKGEPREYPIDTPISEYLKWYNDRNGTLVSSPNESNNGKNFIVFIMVNGILDGINPCAIAVLLFFISFLFMVRQTKTRILVSGLIYILSIFIVYFLIGLGILNAIIISNEPHLMAKIGAALIIFLGILNIISFLWPEVPLKLEIPEFSRTRIKDSLKKATMPSTLFLGVLVGLCTFPCSGGIYIATIGLLTLSSTYFSGILYLLIYNFMFILPLIIILGFVTDKRILKKTFEWHNSGRRIMKLIMGIVMILIGILILNFWV